MRRRSMLQASAGAVGLTALNALAERYRVHGQDLTPIRFTLDWAVQGIHAVMAIGLERGYFADAGLDLSFDRGFGSADSVTKVASGTYDMGFGDINSMMEFNTRNPDSQVRAVAIYYNESPMCAMTLKESGIDSPEQLAGKSVGSPAGGAVLRMFPLFAKTVGFDPESVEVINIEPNLQQTVLINKDVDFIIPFTVTAIPNLAQQGITEEDLNIFRFSDYGIEIYGNSVLASLPLVEEQPEVVESFLGAFVQSIQEMVADPEAAIELLTEYDDLINTDLELQRLQLALDTLVITPEVEANGFGGVDEERLARSIQQVVEAFDLPETPATGDVFVSDFLPPQDQRQLG